MPNTTHITLDSVQNAIEILAHNQWMFKGFNVHDKDNATVYSLATSQYPWTEKQGKLALRLLKQYKTLFVKFQIDLDPIIDPPVWREDFRKIEFEKSIALITDDNGDKKVQLTFPYTEKLIKLIRCLKDKKLDGFKFSSYNGETKKWTFDYVDVNCYYLTLIATRYDFTFLSKEIFNEYETIKKEKLNYRPTSIKIENNKLIFKHSEEEFDNWWEENYKLKPLIQQLDVMNKHIMNRARLTANIPELDPLTKEIAFSTDKNIWIDKNNYTYADVFHSLLTLDNYPIFIPFPQIDTASDLKYIQEFITAWKSYAGESLEQIAFTFNFSEPVSYKAEKIVFGSHDLTEIYGPKGENDRKEIYEDWLDIVSLSKSLKKITKKTKILFINRKLSRTFLASNIKPKAALSITDVHNWPTSSTTVNTVVDNLPKRLYYSKVKVD